MTAGSQGLSHRIKFGRCLKKRTVDYNTDPIPSGGGVVIAYGKRQVNVRFTSKILGLTAKL